MIYGSKTVKTTRGFSIVELVVVIAILGIVSVLGIGLFGDRSSFSAQSARDQFISRFQLAQQQALTRQSGGQVTLQITQGSASDNFVVDIEQAGLNISEPSTISGGDVFLSAAVGGDCSETTSAFSAPAFAFDGLGGLVLGQDVEFCLNTASSLERFCVSALGFAFEGPC